MVAVSLLSLIILGLVLTFNQVQKAVRSGTGQADVLEGGRAAMNLVARDLQELSAFGQENLTNFFTYRAYDFTEQDLPSGGKRQNLLNDMFFVAKRNDEWAIVAYRVDATNGGLLGPLMRFEMAFTNSLLADQMVNNSANPPYAFDNVLTNRIGRWLADPANTNFHRVAGNLVHFSVTASDNDGISFADRNDARTNLYYGTNYLSSPTLGDVYQFTDRDVPAYVDIEMGVLDPGTATRVQARADASAQQGEDFLRKQAGRVDIFRQRIAIRPAATRPQP